VPAELTANARKVLERRYLRRDLDARVVETPEALFRRVACAVAEAEERWRPSVRARWEDAFLRSMLDLEFLPNSPTLMNAGTEDGLLSACFVIPVAPTAAGLLEALEAAALVQRSGGGTGFSLSRLPGREDADDLGAVRVLDALNAVTQAVSARGRRRGANMGILRADHPDVLEFVRAKLEPGRMEGFNVSVGATDAFLVAVERDAPWDLRDPRTGAVRGTLRARELWREIARAAWLCGDPGMVFLDTIEGANPTPGLGTIEATNPCGEVPLLPWESCNLGSVSLARFVGDGGASFDFEGFRRAVRLATRFLDDVIEVNRHPLPALAEASRRTRKIGVGVMGLAEALARMRIPYASDEALRFGAEVARVLDDATRDASLELARERGTFPAWPGSRLEAAGLAVRNATRCSIAPTGTISILAGTSSGIEPFFALAYRRTHVLDGTTLTEVEPNVRDWLAENDPSAEETLAHVERAGRLPPDGPGSRLAEGRRLFATALEIEPATHLAMQEAFQRHVDNAVSKTVNLPEDATEEDVSEIFRRAHALGLKGVAVFRYGCRRTPAFSIGV
jgi:ribonucleoside-diphosphate reductase alpha chain